MTYRDSGHFMVVESYGDQWKCRIVRPSTKQTFGTPLRDTRAQAIADGLNRLHEEGRKFRGEKKRNERGRDRLRDALDHGQVADVFASMFSPPTSKWR